MNAKKVFAKYDIRGIQSFIFSTDKLREIRAVQDLPEKLLFESLVSCAKEKFNEIVTDKGENEILTGLKKTGIDVLDKAGGNAYVIYDNIELYKEISKAMALYIVSKTYSLKLIYGCVDVTGDFHSDYNNLNEKVGKIKSVTPGKLHIGALSVCKQDRSTGRAYCGHDDRDPEILKTAESLRKLAYSTKGRQMDDFTADENSVIAIIHIDGNNMGARINELLDSVGKDYEKAREVLGKICVKDRFADVCGEIAHEAENIFGKDWDKKYIYALIQAGDDITYITRGDIALSFTKRFLELTHDKFMCDKDMVGGDEKYLLSACAGIVYCHSHFPFIEAYDLADKLCLSTKKKAKSNKSESGFIGSWIDFEYCRSIHNSQLEDSRRAYSNIGGTSLIRRPYCVKHKNYSNDKYDIDEFIKTLEYMTDDSEDTKCPVRSHWKELREAYFEGKTAADILRTRLVSRGKDIGEFYTDDNSAVYFDAIEVMDLYVPFKTENKTEENAS